VTIVVDVRSLDTYAGGRLGVDSDRSIETRPNDGDAPEAAVHDALSRMPVIWSNRFASE